MSVRDEDRRKNCSSSSRGLGLAAAAIGVGVGAALYYFFSKRPEQPDTEGSTSEGWTVEQPQTLSITPSPKSEYTTISEHTTTDTSIWITDNEKSCNNFSIRRNLENWDISSNIPIVKKLKFHSDRSSTDDSTMDSSFEDSYESSGHECCNSCSFSQESEFTLTDTDSDIESLSSDTDYDSEDSMANESMEEEESQADSDQDSSLETGYVTLRTTSSHSNNMTQGPTWDSDMEDEWDVTNSSADVPENTSYNSSPFFRNIIRHLTSPRLRNPAPVEDERTRIIREQAFRERRWSLEECAICFEVMLKDQPLMQLPCTHNFHVGCIGPWLQEQQTCPVCRKAAE
ncbi:hypothetical protein O0L34_g7840 [Tuta absoluta]|nr:hypothetical protein O0L34_g7840 [Tuta absoluta]